MKAVCVLFAVLAVALAFDLDAPVINRDLIEAINADPESSWVAGENARLAGMNIRDFSKLLGVKPSNERLPYKKINAVDAIPASFDARTNWPNCIGAVLDQGHCGSCWAFGAVESLEDRFCIQGNVNVELSEQMLVSCDNTNDGCDGGQLITAWQYLKKHGTVTEECYPYDMGTCHHPGCSEWNTPSCNKTCQNGDKYTDYLYYADSAYSISSLVSDIQTEIMTKGPVEVSMAVYEDFANYKSGVYIHTNGTLLGYHAIKNIGWGVDANGVDYWIIQNSWNTDWGMDGYFWIRRGTDECGIEDNVVAGLAKIKSL
jgi:cathepsin B